MPVCVFPFFFLISLFKFFFELILAGDFSFVCDSVWFELNFLLI